MKICSECGYENEDINQNCIWCGAELKPKKSGRGLIIGLVCALVLVVAVAAVSLILYYNSDSQVYLRAMSNGNKQYNLQNYEAALEYYQAALEVNSSEEKVYLYMAYSYNALNRTEEAIAILEQGYSVTSSTMIAEKISEYSSSQEISSTQTVDDTSLSGEYTVEEAAALSTYVGLNSDILIDFANYTYTNYNASYGTPEVATSDGMAVVTYEGYNFTLYFYDTEENTGVLNNSTGEPKNFAKPTEIVLGDLGILFAGFSGAVTGDRIEVLIGDTVNVVYNETEGRYEITFAYNGCSITLETDTDGNVLSSSNYNSISPLVFGTAEEETEEGEAETAHVYGYVTDAGDNTVVLSGVSMKFFLNGEEVETISTYGDGYYEIDLEPATYTLEMSCDGYVTETVVVEVLNTDDMAYYNLSLQQSVTVATDAVIRIETEWTNVNEEIDPRCVGTFSDGTWMFLCNHQPVNGTAGTACYGVADPYGYSVNGTMTQYIYDAGASFLFYIYAWDWVMYDLSGVTVRVYIDDVLVQTFTGQNMTDGCEAWEVFVYDNGTYTALDTYY